MRNVISGAGGVVKLKNVFAGVQEINASRAVRGGGDVNEKELGGTAFGKNADMTDERARADPRFAQKRKTIIIIEKQEPERNEN